MQRSRAMRSILSIFSWALLLAAPSLAAPALAADICTETVPANRFIDGFPAYAQCAGSMTGAVYSDDGINTSTTSGGTGWVRTQGSGGYQCTELAHRYLHFRFNVGSVPNGNAGVWCDATIPAGLEKVTTPVHGDLIVFAPGSCGADATTGHVAVIDTVNADSSVTAIQQNVASRSKYNMSCAACFIHAIANDGTSADGGVGTADAATGGVTGTAGRGGSPGTAGTTGAAGTVGATGAAGTLGTTATAGTVGTTGAAGTTGTAGVVGTTGVAGTVGATGTAGAGPGAAPDGLAGGCACELTTSNDRDAGLGLVVLLALTSSLVVRRRRPSRREPEHAAQGRRAPAQPPRAMTVRARQPRGW